MNKNRGESPITKAQIINLFVRAADAGISHNDARRKIVDAGYASAKDIKQKDYNRVRALFENNENE